VVNLRIEGEQLADILSPFCQGNYFYAIQLTESPQAFYLVAQKNYRMVEIAQLSEVWRNIEGKGNSSATSTGGRMG